MLVVAPVYGTIITHCWPISSHEWWVITNTMIVQQKLEWWDSLIGCTTKIVGVQSTGTKNGRMNIATRRIGYGIGEPSHSGWARTDPNRHVVPVTAPIAVTKLRRCLDNCFQKFCGTAERVAQAGMIYCAALRVVRLRHGAPRTGYDSSWVIEFCCMNHVQ